MASQDFLPGTAPKRVRAIHEAAERLIERTEDRKAAKEREDEARDRLIALMKKHELPVYGYDGLTVTLEEKDKLTVKMRPAGDTFVEDDDAAGDEAH